MAPHGIRGRVELMAEHQVQAVPAAGDGAAGLAPQSPPPDDPGGGVIGRANALAEELLGPETAGAAVLSPLSLLEALAPLMAAARGATADRLRSALFGGDATRPLKEFIALSRALCDTAGPLPQQVPAVPQHKPLHRASALWVMPGQTFSEHFASALGTVGVTLDKLDLSSPTATSHINDWVRARTEGLIPGILTTLPADTLAVATAALHFAARWAQGFDPAETEPGLFARPDAPLAEVLFMRASISGAAYAQNGTLHAVLLPYQGGEFEFIALAPVPGQDPWTIVASAGQRQTLSLLQRLRFAAVDRMKVELPRFAIASPVIDLLPRLQHSRLASALGPDADYGGATGQPWSVSGVFHRAMMRVDESGTEAAAATAILASRSIRSSAPRFRAESPFLAVVRPRAPGPGVVAALVMDPCCPGQ